MAVRIIKTSWWVDFRFNHRRYRRRSPENSKAGAEAYEASLRHKLARGESIDAVSKDGDREPLFKAFAQTWFDEYVILNNKISEQRNKKYILSGALVPFFGRMKIKEVTARVIEQYKAKKMKDGITNKTIKNHLTLLNRCLKTAYDWLELDGVPPKINWPKCAPTEMDFLSFDECELLLSNADGIDYEMMLTAVKTGMRQGELKALQWPSIDWENRSIAVRYSRDDLSNTLVPPKNNRIRHIPMDADVYDALYRRKKDTGYVFVDANGRPLTHRRLSRRIRNVCENAGLRKIGWHTFRHTFASHLVMRGVPLTAVKELRGHASITTTMRYSHLAPSALRAAIEMLSPKSILAEGFGQRVGNRWLRTQERQDEPGKSALRKAA